MKKNKHSYQLAFLKLLTFVCILSVSFLIVKDVLAQTPTEPIYPSQDDESYTTKILRILFNQVPQPLSPIPVLTPTNPSNDCIDTSNAGADQNFTGSGAVDTTFNYQSIGLIPPNQADIDAQYAKLSGNSGYWARRLLTAEKLLISKGVKVKPYLTTAWMWFENSSSLSPYAINCNDNRAGFSSEVSFFCSSNNFQIAGYQAASRAGGSVNYGTMFKKCYGDIASVPNVLNSVVSNSDKVSTAKWSYLDPDQKLKDGLVKKYLGGIGSVTLDKIAPKGSFRDPEVQFYSLILGKDPCIAVGLNSAAVSDTDLVRALKSPSCGYGYICAPQKAKIAAMIGALRKLDAAGGGITGQPSGTAGPSPSPRPTCAPVSAIGTPNPNATQAPLGSANVDNYVHYCQCDPKWGGGDMCGSGCGLNSISSAMSTLGQPTTPNQLMDKWKGTYWSAAEGMNTTLGALMSLAKDPNSQFTTDGNNLMAGGQLDVNAARVYFINSSKGNFKNKCILIGSFHRYVPGYGDASHVVAISGVNDDGTITVHDSWLGCNPGSTSEKVSYRRQNPDYVNLYAYPLCRKN